MKLERICGLYMTFEYDFKIEIPNRERNKRKAFFKAKKMLPEYVFDTSKLENNPMTFPEVKTLIDGITVGGHKVSDMQQVLNIKDTWVMLLDSLQNNKFEVSKKMTDKVNGFIARQEALEWGKFRTGRVGISGTSLYQAPDFRELDNIFDTEIDYILGNFDPIEQAIRLFLWGALNQFYWDGNKRTFRIMANGILLNSGVGIFNIKTKDIPQFNALMVEFYETKTANNIVKFLIKNCIDYID